MAELPYSGPTPYELDRRGLLAGAVALGGAVLMGPADSADAAARPYISTRGRWKARPPSSAATVANRKPDHIVVHHTASANSGNYSSAHAYALSRSIQKHHMSTNGWSDTGQQFTIGRGGHLMEGRNRSISALNSRKHVVGAHVSGHNSHTVGIECEGLYTSATPPAALWDTLVRLCAYLCDAYNLPASAIVGHRNYNATSCPGNKLYSMLPTLRKQVAGRLTSARLKFTYQPMPDLGADLPGPRFEFDHGPSISFIERGRRHR